MKLGVSAHRQDVSGASSGEERYDQCRAQGEAGETKCLTPESDDGRFGQACYRGLGPGEDVSVSKVPEMRSVGMLLATGRCIASERRDLPRRGSPR